jgi:hypothetical protein
MQVRGSFGSFVGRVDSIEPEGLAGLHPDPAYDPGLPLPPEPIPWSQVSTVSRQGTQSRRGAWIGGVVLGSLGAAAGGWIASGVGSGEPRDIAGGMALGGVACGVVGAWCGSLVGAHHRGWQDVYSAPLLVQAGSQASD